ncbi:MAG: c-type cytochrome [Gammaproteobacteria bacterium]|nr:c-type cytochrome [Gammaproteobacteria bacterium]
MRFNGRLIPALFVLSLLVPTVVFAWPWSTDMMNQPSVKPQETYKGKIFSFPARSIPTIGVLTTVANRDEAKSLQNPIAVTEGSIKIGKRLFIIYCSACHGLSGKADSPVSPKIGAIDLTTEYVQKDLTEGWLFGTITFGGAIMPAYGISGEGGGSNDLSVEERWHVVNYVRNQLAKQPVVASKADK